MYVNVFTKHCLMSLIVIVMSVSGSNSYTADYPRVPSPQTVVVQASHVQPLEDVHLDGLHGRGRGGQDHHRLPGLV